MCQVVTSVVFRKQAPFCNERYFIQDEDIVPEGEPPAIRCCPLSVPQQFELQVVCR